jgi:hypothetical protein
MVLKVILILAALLLPPLLLRLLGRPLSGSLLGIPYSFAPPTPGRVKQTVWNPSSDRLLAPHVYGWGYTLNVHALARRLGLLAA